MTINEALFSNSMFLLWPSRVLSFSARRFRVVIQDFLRNEWTIRIPFLSVPYTAQWGDEKLIEVQTSVFQIRSSWAQFCRFQRFERLEKSVSYVFSIRLNIPTPPASTILNCCPH